MHDEKPSAGGSTRDVSPMALAGLGLQFGVALVAFGYIGQWLDNRFHSSPAFLMTGIFLGGGGTFYASYKRIMKATNSPPADAPPTHKQD